MSTPMIADGLIAALMVFGAMFALIGAIGLAKLKHFVTRLHGPTKASTLGVGGALLAAMLHFAFSGEVAVGRELLITVFVFITAPVSAHMMIKAALRGDPSEPTLQPPPQPSPDAPQ